MPEVSNDRQLLSRLFKRAVVLPLLVMALLTVLLIWQVYQLVMSQQLAQHSDQILIHTQQVARTLVDEQTAMRNFLVDHDARAIETFHDASEQIDPALDDLVNLVRDNPFQHQRMEQLATQTRHWESVFGKLVNSPPQSIPTQDDLALYTSEANRMDALRIDFRAFNDTERGLHDERNSRAIASMHWALGTAGALALASILLAFASRKQLIKASVEFDRALNESEARQKIIRENEELFRATFDHAPVGIGHFSIDGHWLMTNDRLSEILGYSRDKLLKRSFRDITHPDDLAASDEMFRRTLAGEIDHFSLEKRYIRENGTIVWVNKTVALLRDSNGAPNYFIGTVEDISAQKRFEQSLSDAKEQAESANQAKDQFLAVLSHELRTPLTPVLAITSALQTDRSLPEQFKGDIEMIRRNIEWEAHLINDLLDLNAIAKRKIQFQSEVVDLHSLIENVSQLCATEARAGKLQLKLQLDAGWHFVHVDPRRFQQVIRNLLQNAIKFTDPGGSIVIATSNMQKDQICLEVSDTGIGMPADLIPRLFTPFEQGERTVTRKFGGLGLGLAICKAMVEAHGGTITASSLGIGHGSTFAIALQTVAMPLTTGHDAPQTSGPSVANTGRRILLVEDHPDTLRTMARLLKTCKYDVETAATVAEAIQRLQDGPFDLLISDLGLPDGSGYDVMRYVKDHHPMRAIALSGFGMPEDIKKSLDAGFFEHITKPINFDRLQRAIDAIE